MPIELVPVVGGFAPALMKFAEIAGVTNSDALAAKPVAITNPRIAPPARALVDMSECRLTLGPRIDGEPDPWSSCFLIATRPPVANASAIPNRQAVIMRGCRCDIKQISPRLCHASGHNWLFLRHVAKRSRNGISTSCRGNCHSADGLTLRFCGYATG